MTLIVTCNKETKRKIVRFEVSSQRHFRQLEAGLIIDNDTKDGGPEAVGHSYSFYHGRLWPYLCVW